MIDPWKIEYYEFPSGDKPVEKFINQLEEKTQVKVTRMLDLLEEFGIKIGLPHAKKLIGTDLWELRILGANNIRILYISMHNRIFLLLHAFKKKTQRIERKEIKIALDRLNEYRLRKQN